MSKYALAVHEVAVSYAVKEAISTLPAGYKPTDFGAIPEDWDSFRIGDVALKVGSGITPTGGNRVYKNSGSPFVRSQNVGWGCLVLNNVAYIDEATHSSFDSTEIKVGDVLLNITGASIGRAAVADLRIVGGNVNQHVCIIRVDRKVLEPSLLCAFLVSSAGQKQIDSFQAGGNRQGLNFEQVRSIRLAAPRAIGEQKEIANVLKHMDALLQELDLLIAKKRDIKQATMQELLTGQTRLPGFEGQWHGVQMRDLLTQNATYGVVTAGNFVSDGVRMVRGGDINDGRISLDLPMITAEKSQEYMRTVLSMNDVVIALVGYPGASAVVPRELVGANISRAVGLLRVNARIDPAYLVCVLNSSGGRKMVLAPSAGSAQQVVNLSALNRLRLFIPPANEQRAIVDVLTDMDAEILNLEKRHKKTQRLKKSMMQGLLSGRIRFV